ncbi:DUF2637 domain-containing protein [Actinomadura madurae]
MVSVDLGASAIGGRGGDRLIRCCTTVSVVVLAGIAAVLSYTHMFELVVRYGEASWTAALLPVSVDGMIVASSMTLLADSRAGWRGGLLPWTLLLVGSAASLAANVAVAEPSMVGRLIAAWPSCALIRSSELLMRQVRNGARRNTPAAPHESAPRTAVKTDGSDEVLTAPHKGLARDDPGSYAAPMTGDALSDGSYGAQMHGTEVFIGDAGDEAAAVRGAGQADPGRGRSVGILQRQAWQWAVSNRTLAGDLPSGKVIAERFERFERCERWGRLVKQAGPDGRFDQKLLRRCEPRAGHTQHLRHCGQDNHAGGWSWRCSRHRPERDRHNPEPLGTSSAITPPRVTSAGPPPAQPDPPPPLPPTSPLDPPRVEQPIESAATLSPSRLGRRLRSRRVRIVALAVMTRLPQARSCFWTASPRWASAKAGAPSAEVTDPVIRSAMAAAPATRRRPPGGPTGPLPRLAL